MPQHSHLAGSSPARTLALFAGACLSCGLAFAQAAKQSQSQSSTAASTSNRTSTANTSGVVTVKNTGNAAAPGQQAKQNDNANAHDDVDSMEHDGESALPNRTGLEKMYFDQFSDSKDLVDDEGLRFLENDQLSFKQRNDLLQRTGVLDVDSELVEQAIENLDDIDDEVGGGEQFPCGYPPELASQFMPEFLNLTGTLRDFVGRQDDQRIPGQAAHPDFEVFHTSAPWNQPQYALAAGAIINVAADELDSEGKPVFRSHGKMIGARDWVSNDPGKPVQAIMGPRPYIAWKPSDTIANMAYPSCNSPGVPGTLVTPAPATREALETAMGAWNVRAVVGADEFAQWYRDVPGVNLSTPFTISLRRTIDTTTNSVKYVFDDRQDPEFINRNGFYPLNGMLFGNGTGYNCAGQSVNSHFTFELDTTFIYKRGCGQVFSFKGDDDVWVFIDGKLVIDLSGTHCVRGQTIDLDRLSWLQDRQPYTLKFFSAERQRCGSNIAMETNLELRTLTAPESTGLFD